MNAQVEPDKLDSMFEALIDALSEALDLAVRPDRGDRLEEVAAYCLIAAQLTADALGTR